MKQLFDGYAQCRICGQTFRLFFKRNQGSLFFPLHSIWNFNSPHSGSFSLVRNPPSVPSCQLLPFSGLGVIRFWSDSCNFNEITWSSSCGESLSSHPEGGESYPQERFESMKPTDKGHKKRTNLCFLTDSIPPPGGKKLPQSCFSSAIQQPRWEFWVFAGNEIVVGSGKVARTKKKKKNLEFRVPRSNHVSLILPPFPKDGENADVFN